MRHVGVALAAIVIASSFIGCPLLKKKQAAAEDDPDPDPTTMVADAATVTVTGIGAKNEDQVLRYENETPLPNEAAVIATDDVVARTFPGNGTPVAPLPKGTPVAKIARYFSTSVLVMFDDPSGDGSKLIGWVPPKAFDAAAPAPTKTVVVPPPKIDAGKSTPPQPPNPQPPNPQPPTTRDAGGGKSTAVVDAGGGGKTIPVVVVDAGGGNKNNNSNTDKIPQPPRGVQAVPPVNGKCPDNWTVAEGMCRRKCNTDADCDRGIKCATKGGAKVCTSDR